jgi:uncharacterized Tic20 family protein
MENTMLYTLSTISGVLATVAGLLGGFAIFHFQSIKNSFNETAGKFISELTKLTSSVLPCEIKSVSLESGLLHYSIVEGNILEIQKYMSSILGSVDEFIQNSSSILTEKQMYEVKNIHWNMVNQDLGYSILLRSYNNKRKYLFPFFQIAFILIVISLILLSLSHFIGPILAYIIFSVFFVGISFSFLKIYYFIRECL